MKLENFGNKAVALTAIIGVLALVWTGIKLFDSTYARAEKLDYTIERLEQEIQADNELQEQRRLEQIQERIWQLERRYQDAVMPPSVLEEYQRLKFKLEQKRKK